MHATDLNQEKKKGIAAPSPVPSYSLESLMALQKILENGLPDAPTPLPRPVTPSNGTEKSFQASFRPQPDRSNVRAGLAWKARLRCWLLKLRKAKEADKGHSAQQTG